VVAALWALLSPASVGRFAAMLAAEVVSVARDMPAVGSHTLLVAVAGASVLACAAPGVRRSGRPPRPGELFEQIAPFLRGSLLLVYAAAALAKLNTDFLDAATSCAVAMSRQVAWFDPDLLDGSWRASPAIWGTLLVEASLPVLLAVRRTRRLGLLAGVTFHAVLALAGNVPFSALALAFYVAFLPRDTPARLRRLTAAAEPRLARVAGWSARRAAFGVLVALWVAAAALFDAEPALGRAVIANGTRVLVAGAAVAAGVLLVLARPAATGAVSGRGLGHPALALGIAILAANALSPYLGFKTESSFTMFSNLRTEAGHWNHLVIPEAVRVLRFQDRLVRIADTNDPRLERRGSRGGLLVYAELERYLRGNSQVRAVAVRGQAGPAAVTPSPTPLLDKVAKFRDVPAPGERDC